MKVTVKVTPRAKKERILIDKDGSLRCYVSAPPAEGKANEAVLKMLAKELGIAKSFLSVVRGHSSRIKVLEVAGFNSLSEIYKCLGFSDWQDEQREIF